MTIQTESRAPASGIATPATGRWVQLALGVLCMTMIANLQYGWTLFVNPLHAKFGWEMAAIQWAFTIFILTETWLIPFEGYLEDRLGPRPLVLVGGIMIGLSWLLNSQADSLAMLYVAQAIGGIGAGCVYGTCVGNALKWFPDRRGLAAGVTAAGFGMGSALTIIPISIVIASQGYEAAFLYFGLLQGIVIILVSFLLRSPSKDQFGARVELLSAKRSFAPTEMLKTPVFWIMYLMFVMMAAGGLMATAQLAPIAKDFKVADVPVSLVGITLPALTFALSLDRVLNGVTRPFFGWVSDKIGRETTMFIAFGIEGVGLLALARMGHDPILFVVLTGLVFFAWGEIYSLFPATCGDTFGSKFATTNAGLLYTAKGTASLLVPFSSLLTQATGNWHAVFYTAAGMNILAAILALAVLRPMRQRMARSI
ncbi:oxalate/formate MFS antiporter [Hyphomicrobium sp. B1]|uniref:oxalate/formate MFS antiporter n=1 Tax=Hyphomicrobium sp. B1 TaxID=3075651 RepID=UPI003C2FDE9E